MIHYEQIEANNLEGTFLINIKNPFPLRQIILRDIPVPALSSVVIVANSSCYQNDLISQRIKYIPVRHAAETFFKDIRFGLSVQGPCDVLASDITGVEVTHPNIYITKLKEGQQIDIEGVCTIGTGKQSSIFSCTSNVHYIEISSEVYKLKIESVGQLHPKQILDIAIKLLKHDNR